MQEATRLPGPEPLLHPKVLGRFQCEARLGGDGGLETYRARVMGIAGYERVFAVKCLPAEAPRHRPDAAERFLEAATRMAELKDPRIARVFDADVFEGAVFLATEFVHGVTLTAFRDLACGVRSHGSQGAGLPSCWFAVLAQVGTEAARALATAHALKPPLVHGGLSLSNIMVTPRGNVKLLDFGLRAAVHTEAEAGTEPTLWAYTAPELVLGDGSTPASDLYALGVILYELCAGEAFPAQSGREAEMHREEVLTGVPLNLREAIRALLSTTPEARPGAISAASILRESAEGMAETTLRMELGSLVQRLSQSQARPLLPAVESVIVPTAAAPRAPSSWVPPPRPLGPSQLARKGIPTVAPLPMPAPRAARLSPAVPPARLPSAPSRSFTGSGAAALAPVFTPALRAPFPLATARPDSAVPQPMAENEQTPPDPLPVPAAAPSPDASSTREMQAFPEAWLATFPTPADGHGLLAHNNLAEPNRHDTPQDSAPSAAGEAAGGDADLITPLMSAELEMITIPLQRRREERRDGVPVAEMALITSAEVNAAFSSGMQKDVPTPAATTTKAAAFGEFTDDDNASDFFARGDAANPDDHGSGPGVMATQEVPLAVAEAAVAHTFETPAAPHFELPRVSARRPWTIALAVGLAGVALAGFAGYKLGSHPAPPPLAVAAPPSPPPAPPALVSPPVLTVPAAPAAEKPPVTVASPGRLRLTTTPGGAMIWLDGVFRGTTPTEFAVPEGAKRMALVRPGFQTVTVAMDPLPGPSLALPLAPTVAPPFGAAGLKVDCLTKGRFPVLVDGAETGLVCPTPRIGLVSGPHVVAILDPASGELHSQTVVLRPGLRTLKIKR